MGRFFVKQPHGFWPIIFTEGWERFSFYGLRSFLVLFMTMQLCHSDEMTLKAYASLMSLLYVTPLIGGYLGDRFLGKKFSICLGMLHMVVCHALLFIFDGQCFNLSLAFLISGSGYFKPNIVAMVGGIFDRNDPRRDSGFTYFYMAVNVGSLFAPICGFCAQRPDLVLSALDAITFNGSPLITLNHLAQWQIGFCISGAVILIGLFAFMFLTRGIEISENESVIATPMWQKLVIGLASFGFVFLIFGLMEHHYILDVCVLIFGAAAVGYWIFISMKCPSPQKNALFVCLALFLCNIFFVAIFEQSGGSLTLFIDRNLDRSMGGFLLPASIFQGLNPVLVIFLAPLLALLWHRLYLKNIIIGAPIQFGLSLVQVGGGLMILAFGCSLSLSTGIVSMWWLFWSYLLITCGELIITPIGLSLVTRVCPQEHVSVMTAIWYLSYAFAHYLGGIFATLLMSIDKHAVSVPTLSIGTYMSAFKILGIGALVLGGITLIFSSKFNKVLQKY